MITTALQPATVPPEILGHIFTFLVPGTALIIPSSDLETLFRVIRTCSTWRTIALQHPHLWSDLDIRLHSWSDWETISAVRMCLKFSASTNQLRLLSIWLYIKKYINNWTSFTGFHAPMFLIPHSHRIRKLSILSPLSLTLLVLPRLVDLEVLTPGLETHPDMHIPALLERSRAKITHLTVSSILDWNALLSYASHIEVLVTEGALAATVMRDIAKGTLGVALREVKCAVAFHDCDTFLDMLEARASMTREVDFLIGVSVITKVDARCVNFSLDARQLLRVHGLAPKIHVTITEGSVT
ncbi:hypothetical protein BDZ94DRAFT_1311844 [Collybia nuda]|uniref:F-box domain-containing protein n=1 Tax=Collybia nuda TaxID=64659 RepID=A0A9P6CGL8_9AGAR|nr:hypothetical protein BDZ94DRAFT_1311844 [Collybia nuda]